VATAVVPVVKAVLPQVVGGNGSATTSAAATTAQKKVVDDLAKGVGQLFGPKTALAALVTVVVAAGAQWGLGHPMVTMAVVAVVLGGVWVIGRKPIGTDGSPEGARASAALRGTGASHVPQSDQPITGGTPVPQSDQAITGGTPVRRAWKRAFIIATCAALIAAIIVVGRYWEKQQRPADADVSAYIAHTVAPLPVRVTAINPTYGKATSAGCPVTFQARLETTEPLFRRIDTAEYLRTHAAAEMAAMDAADALLKGVNGSAVRARLEQGEGSKEEGGSNPSNQGITGRKPVTRAGASAPAGSSLNPKLSSLNSLILVTTATPPRTEALATGTALAWKGGGAWVLTGGSVQVDRTRIVGDPKPADAYAVDLPEDAARLKTLIAERAAYALNVQAAAKALAVDLERERQQKATALTQLLQRGMWFTGTVEDTTRVLLEVTDCSATTHQITLALRNDRGIWSRTRPFTGEWAVSADGESCTAKVRTRSADRISSGGAVLDDPNAWYLTLQLRLDGTVSVDPREWQLRRVDPAELLTVQRQFGLGAVSGRSDPLQADTNPPSPQGGYGETGNPLPTKGATEGNRPVSTRPATPSAPGGRALPPFPGSVGAYVLSDEGQWLPLPRNNGHIVQSFVQKANGFFGWLNDWQNKIAGTAVPDEKEITGQWMFDGGTPVPVVSGDDVVVIYAGALMIDPKLVAKYPQLQLEPLMEMAPLWWLDSGIRSVPLTSPAPKLYGFGPLRIPATVERPALAITMLHCTARLPARHYAVACGGVGFELAVQ
jgi:hypothetical protein